MFDVKLKGELTREQNPYQVINRFKARVVARGDSQVEGMNFNKVYAPVVRFASLRIIVHLAALYNFELEQGDFWNAFLNGVLEDIEIYMTQPEGYVLFNDETNRPIVCLLKKSLYGLQQAARIWYACLHDTLVGFGMKRITHDQAIWKLRCLSLSAHVNDVLMCGDLDKVNTLKQHLAKAYRFKDLGASGKYVGVYFIRDRKNRRLYLDQAPYVKEILEEFNMANCTPCATPMDPRET